MAKKKVQTKTRRANNEGSIYQRKDGLWVGMISLGYDDDGKQKRKAVYGKSKVEVSKKLAELTNRITSDNYDYVANNNLETLMKDWLMVFKKAQVTPRTFENNIAKFKNYIVPKIGGIKIDEITTITIQKMLNEMQDQELSWDYVKKTKNLLGQFFDYAVDRKFVIENPMRKVKLKSQEHKVHKKNEYKAIPVEVRDEFVEKVKSHKLLKPLCYTLMFAGLRVGEALALEWKDVDFANKTIKVERAMTNVPKFDNDGDVVSRKIVVGDTKTVCSQRVVPMPDILVAALKEYKEIRESKDISFVGNESFIFGNEQGELRSYGGTKTIFERFLKSNDLDKYDIHFHTLRHTYSNTLFEAEQNPKVIQQLLGHKDVKTTITTYNSVDKSYFDKAKSVFNEQYQVEEEQDSVANANDEELDKELERILKEKERRRKRQKDFEM